jgi:hypothetical protein
MLIRSLEPADKPWNGSEDALARDAFGVGERPIGFVAWTRTYDLHHCVTGGSVCDMFVEHAHRGRGVALQLVAFAANGIRKACGIFVQGQAVQGREKEYARIAVSFPGASCIIGGRAFRTLADLVGESPRTIARHLPAREWKFEP